MNARTIAALAAAALALVRPLARPLAAQQTDVIRGRVTSSVGDRAIEGARVTATSLSGSVNRTATTDRNGRYTITFPGTEGDYFVTVVALGFAPRRFEVKRTADQDILLGDVRLAATTNMLDTVVTLGRRARPIRGDSIPEVSGTERPVNPDLVAVEQAGDLAAMAATLPGVLYIEGTNGDPSGFSLLGLDGFQNAVAINGMISGAAGLPRDANVSVTLATSPYDVSQGQFSAARINVGLPSGSNYVTRTSSLRLNAPQLEWTDPAGRALGQRYTDANLGGLASGPIALDKAFYNISYQLGRRANSLQTLLDTDPLGLAAAGVAADSVTRLLGILQGARVPATVPGFPSDRLADQGLVLGSVDFAPPSSSTGQAFNLTFNGAWTKASPVAPLTTVLPASNADATSWNGSVQAHHSSYFGFGILSETGIAVNGSRRYTTPYLGLPSGSVRVNSAFADGASSVRSVTFGGASATGATTTSSVDLANQLSWFSVDNKHRIKLTSELRRDNYLVSQTNNVAGAFAFNSLADLEAGRAASFTRQLAAARSSGRELIAALSLGDSYRRTPDLQVQYGVRLDANRFLDRPAANADVERLFGARNDRVPNGVYVSPRIGFSWTYGTAPRIGAFAGAARLPRAVVRGGIGIFQNSPSVSLPSQVATHTGLPGGVQQLTCVGAATPVPDWGAYLTDPASIPTLCAGSAPGSVFASAAPNVALFAGDYAPQRSLRSTLQWQGAVLGNRAMATVTGTYSYNMRQTGLVDLNLDPAARFTLDGEGSRPVFVEPTSIVPATGAIASRDGRVSPLFNHVTELRSDLTSIARQLTVQLSPAASSSHYTWGLSYTLNSVRDQAIGFASTAGNPFDASWGRSALDWRHQIQFNIGYNLFDVVRVNWVQSVFSGFPYTPTVGGDVNGDGYAMNDRAFVFDPSRTGDPALASAMQSLLSTSLSTSSGGARECLTRQLGRLAARNSCEGPWTSTAAMSIAFNPLKVRMPQRAMISFSIANPLGAADLLLHGEHRTHGWGQAAVPDPWLLFVRGFDPQTRSYRYEVNKRFGNTSQSASAVRNPVTLTALVRVDLGPARERQTLTHTLDRGRTTPGEKVSAAELRNAYGSAGLINPLATILRAIDSLKLTGKQADSIAMMNRWYLVHLDSIWSPVVADYAKLPDRYDRAAAYDRYCRAREATVDLIAKLAPAIRSLLTTEQRRKLPELVAAYLDPHYLAAIRSGMPRFSSRAFEPVGVASGGGRGRGG